MRILQIGSNDLIGRKFNGYDLNIGLNKRNIKSSHYVWIKKSDNDDTISLKTNFFWDLLNRLEKKLEKILSIQSILYFSSFRILFKREFREADIIHLHLIHDFFFSIIMLPLISRRKKVLWTLHDPWAITGHCIYPIGCKKYEVGCHNCPDLNLPFPIKKDTSALMWKFKKYIYRKSKLEVIVASKWMFDLVKKSPLLREKTCHLIPYGINLEKYTFGDSQRNFFNINDNSTVIFFRATKNIFKGLDIILNTLRQLDCDKKITIICVDEIGLLYEFKGKFRVIDLGWINDEVLLTKAFNSCDIFLMPSKAEAFGVMAIEAMASGKLVLTIEGTALLDIIFSPLGGYAAKDESDFKNSLIYFIENPKERKKIGLKAKELATKHYSIENHIDLIEQVYKKL